MKRVLLSVMLLLISLISVSAHESGIEDTAFPLDSERMEFEKHDGEMRPKMSTATMMRPMPEMMGNMHAHMEELMQECPNVERMMERMKEMMPASEMREKHCSMLEEQKEKCERHKSEAAEKCERMQGHCEIPKEKMMEECKSKHENQPEHDCEKVAKEHMHACEEHGEECNMEEFMKSCKQNMPDQENEAEVCEKQLEHAKEEARKCEMMPEGKEHCKRELEHMCEGIIRAIDECKNMPEKSEEEMQSMMRKKAGMMCSMGEKHQDFSRMMMNVEDKETASQLMESGEKIMMTEQQVEEIVKRVTEQQQAVLWEKIISFFGFRKQPVEENQQKIQDTIQQLSATIDSLEKLQLTGNEAAVVQEQINSLREQRARLESMEQKEVSPATSVTGSFLRVKRAFSSSVRALVSNA